MININGDTLTIADQDGCDVVSFIREDDVMTIIEDCDTYFSSDLDKERVGDLIEWLQSQYNSME